MPSLRARQKRKDRVQGTPGIAKRPQWEGLGERCVWILTGRKKGQVVWKSLMFSNAPCELMKGTVGQIGTVILVTMGQERSGMD